MVEGGVLALMIFLIVVGVVMFAFLCLLVWAIFMLIIRARAPRSAPSITF